jgi:PAS domain S-box-containing protein
MARPLRVLHLEDSPLDAEIVRHRLDVEGLSCDILLASTKDSFETALTREPFDLIISDYNLPGYDGVTALKQAQATQPDVPVILISGTVGEEQAVKCLQIGATDYLLKARLERLVPAVQRALQEAETRRQRKHAEHTLLQREQALRDNEERTRFALAAARMGVWEIEFTKNRLTWSDTMAPLFGLTPTTAPKTREDFFQLIHPADRRATEAWAERAVAGERDYGVEFRAIWPDGTPHWILGRAQASYDAGGTPLRLLGIAMDIDQRRSLEDQRNQATESLRTAEERMRFALEAAGVGIWDMDYTTGVIQWSKILESQYGLHAGTFGRTFEAFVERIHPDDRERVVETVEMAMTSGADFSVLNRSIWPDGTVRWLSGAGRIHLGEHGEPARSVGISLDVTERKRAEATIAQSEMRKAAILDSVLDAIVTMDEDGRVIEFNAAAERTFGYTKAEAIGRALADLIIPLRLRDAHRAGLARYLATGEGRLLGTLIEITAVRSDGAEIPVELAISAIHSNHAPLFTGVLRDITARKLAEETRAHLAAIVDSSDDAIFSMALDDTILTWNAGAERLYGYPASDVIGQRRVIIVPPGKGAELTAILAKAARGEAGEPFETQRVRKDGSIVDISLTISPMTDPTGRITSVSSIARDITSRKKAEAELTRLTDEIQLQRLRVFKATIRTVQDIVNNLLNGFQFVRLEAEGQLPAEMLTLVDRMIHEAALKLRTLGELETVKEKEMTIGLGIEYPGSTS